MAQVSDVLSFARTQAQTDSNGLTDARGLIWANEALVDFRRRLIANGVDASQIQEAYRDAIVNQGTYLYPSDMFWLKSIELNYTNTTAGDYKVANQLDIANIPGGKSFGWLRTNANPSTPYFDDRGDWYEIFPTPTAAHDLSQLIRIFYYLEPTEYSSTTSTIAYPESLDYRLLGWRVAASYLYSLEKIKEGDAFNLKYEERIKQLVATLARGSQQPLQAIPIQLSGFEF